MSVATMSIAERREYNKAAKRKERARKKEEKAESLDPSDKRFAEALANMSPHDLRDWIRTWPLYLRLQCKRVAKDCIAAGMGLEKVVIDMAKKTSLTVEEVVMESTKLQLAQLYGFSDEEFEQLLDPSYKKPERVQPEPQPAYDRPEWHRGKLEPTAPALMGQV